MKIKKYLAESIREAMMMIKRELGDNAVILSSRRIKKGGFFGIGGKTYFEITAAVEEKEEEKKVENASTYRLQEILIKNRRSLDDNIKDEFDEIKRTISEIKQILVKEKSQTLPEGLSKISYGMEKQEIIPEIRYKIVEFLKMKYGDLDPGSKEAFKILSEQFSNIIRTKVPDFENVKVLFVGTTGVGKTTTLAKLAARFKIEEKKRVAILTLDTYRIAAAEQLKTYAEIMDIPMKIAYTPKEAEYEMMALKDYDVLLIDTAGRSHQNDLQMSEVKALAEAVKPNITFLVVAMNYKLDDMKKILEKFSVVRPTHLILTKMDETSVYGTFVNISEITDIPIAFVTNGQRVPDDIFEANSVELARIVTSEVLSCAGSGGTSQEK
ncbi:flagellar biosynthesis regulator FlhF [Thermotoga sp. RQ7]|uniref:flagellar biosynthesis protein FlhF n=1 Tax=Thermotoga sp. RQ7 TaxID=126738 RepID=UPI0005A30590|nr:flagellar biosynthesis protein FlhF [Thermotoga sp. RQ7]AJG39875.1 flagellar biosynthesis regulator FlhF [Thermotoga sp. RQ7]MDK2786051.1 flagellar biosynthesis protein FlhF [Thermotoga sp.]MDK2949516.1 flagellar biosynthesis protein FlhF [Thermotoga sp.]